MILLPLDIVKIASDVKISDKIPIYPRAYGTNKLLDESMLCKNNPSVGFPIRSDPAAGFPNYSQSCLEVTMLPHI